MNGRVTSSRFPYVPVRVTIRTLTLDLEALLDTGFDGDVIVPAGLIDTNVRPNQEITWTLADGSEVSAPLYIGRATVGDLATVAVYVSVVGSEPLVGRNLIRHFTITLDHGERLTIER